MEDRPNPLRDVKIPGRETAGTDEMAEAVTRMVREEMRSTQATKARLTPVYRAEKRRRKRQLPVTFSDPGIPERLRALARRWDLTGPDGKRPNYSAVVEHLLASQIELAEQGEIDPPG